MVFNNLIYVLLDPDTHEVRYVGMTTRGVGRLKEHFLYGRKYRSHLYKYCWINNVISRGKEPIINILQQWEYIDHQDLCAAEVYWISYFRSVGSPLTNLTDGGEGTVGRKVSKETREKVSKSNRGKKHTQEAKEKIRAAGLGRKYPNRKRPEFKDGWLRELSDAMSGNKFGVGQQHTEEWKQENSARMKGNKHALGSTHTQEWKEEASKLLKGNKYAAGGTPHNKGKRQARCKRGHLSNEKNTYTYSSGKRKCRPCAKELAAISRIKKHK